MDVRVRHLGRADYEPVWADMRAFTDARTDSSRDEFWVVEHPPVFTLGQAGKSEHLLMPGDIPVVHSDRGGQVTYHGPGQLVVYVLVDLRRAGIGVRQLVTALEMTMIDVLATDHGIDAVARADAPGVYVTDAAGAPGAKIGALGLRVRRGRSYHGLALNVNVDLEPFSRINPCGLQGQAVTSIAALRGGSPTPDELAPAICQRLAAHLGMSLQPLPAGLP